MAFTTAGGEGTTLTNEINVTPMIDVLLVLLIIFMMIIPMSRKTIDVQLPDPNPPVVDASQAPKQIVLEVMPGGGDGKATFALNKAPVSYEGLSAKLDEVYRERPEKILFIKGYPDVTYQDVIFAMDMARGAGVKAIGVIPKDAAK